MRVLHLTLKKKWFDMIASDEKKEEYREVKMFWAARFLHGFSKSELSLNLGDLKSAYKTRFGETVLDAVKKNFDAVKFTNGYAKNAPTITLEFKDISIGKAKPEWSDNWQGDVFIIKLGNIIEHPKNNQTK